MGIEKSTRHQKIIGDFGEMVVCNWLSRSGFEVAIVDHTGIDVIAYKKGVGRIGISVKSRTRNMGKEDVSVNLLSHRKESDDEKKMNDACDAFGCEPWLGIYVEADEGADLYLLPLAHYRGTYGSGRSRSVDTWAMTRTARQKYEADPVVRHIHFTFQPDAWRW